MANHSDLSGEKSLPPPYPPPDFDESVPAFYNPNPVYPRQQLGQNTPSDLPSPVATSFVASPLTTHPSRTGPAPNSYQSSSITPVGPPPGKGVFIAHTPTVPPPGAGTAPFARQSTNVAPVGPISGSQGGPNFGKTQQKTEAQIGQEYRDQLLARCANGQHEPMTDFGLCGIVTAVVCFPCGLLCLLTDRKRKCARCGVKV